MSKFIKGDYIEVVHVYKNDIKEGLEIGMKGYVLDNDDIPYINFINNELNLDKCLKKNNKLYCYTIFEDQLKLVKERGK